jgi:hypothetical protein
MVFIASGSPAGATVVFDKFRIGTAIFVDGLLSTGNGDELYSLSNEYRSSNDSHLETIGGINYRYVEGYSEVGVTFTDQTQMAFGLRSNVTATDFRPQVFGPSVSAFAYVVYYFTIDQNSLFSLSSVLTKDNPQNQFFANVNYTLNSDFPLYDSHLNNNEANASLILRPASYRFQVNLSLASDEFVGTNGLSSIGTVNITPYAGPLPGSVPEPQSWAMLITGFSVVGATLRRRRNAEVSA